MVKQNQTSITIRSLFIAIIMLFTLGAYSCGSPTESDQDDTTETVDVTEVVEVTSLTGRVWMDRNLGASRAANSSSDADAYGDLYQWGRGSDGHQKRNSPNTSILSSTDQPGHGDFILAPESPWDWRSPQNKNLWHGMNNPCPDGFRLPTEAEWNAERQSWSSNDAAGAFASPLKLPLPGYRSKIGGSLTGAGTLGHYWSGSVSGIGVRKLSFRSNYTTATVNTRDRAYSNSVRCIKEQQTDESDWPRDTETEVVDVTNPVTGRTWMDRNLGASRVATSSTDTQAFGDLYQWGRAADGHEKRNSSTTSVRSNANQPGHGDFIIGSNNWLSSRNDSLWQGENGINNPCPVGYRLPTEAEWNAEQQSWNSNNASGAFASPLKLPTAGNRSNSDGSVSSTLGYYWSASIVGFDPGYLIIDGSDAATFVRNRAYGHSIRCIKDE